MQVQNKTRQPILVFGWNAQGGCGEEVIIDPGMSWYVKGPCIGMKKKREERMDIPGKVTIQENPSRGSRWRRRLEPEQVLCIESRKDPAIGIMVKFFDPEVDD